MDENFRSTDLKKLEYTTIAAENKLLRNSFSWMALAMLLTALSALAFGKIPQLTAFLFTVNEINVSNPTLLGYLVMFSPLAFILALNFGVNRMSLPVLISVFIALVIVMGISMSAIFFRYNMVSIELVFLSTTGLFALMAIAGYTTKTDLTKMGSLLMIGVAGILIASVINIFMGSPAINYLISILGVVIFTGLTAYDVQKLKNIGAQIGNDSTMLGRMGIIGALTLYLDFVNLFLFLLDLFGGRKD